MTDSRSSNQSENLAIPWRDAPRYFFPEHAQKYDAAVRVWSESGARIGGRAVFTGHWTETPDYSRPDQFRMERILPPEAKAVEFAEQDLRLAFWSAIKDCQLLVCFRLRAGQASVALDADDVERLRLECEWEGIVPGHLSLRRSQLFDVNVRRPTIEEKTSFFTVHPRGEWRVVSAEEVFRPAKVQGASMARKGASSAIQAPSTPGAPEVDLPIERPLWLDSRKPWKKRVPVLCAAARAGKLPPNTAAAPEALVTGDLTDHGSKADCLRWICEVTGTPFDKRGKAPSLIEKEFRSYLKATGLIEVSKRNEGR